MRLFEGNPFKTCANPQAHNQKPNRANRYENNNGLNISRFKLFRCISYYLVDVSDIFYFFLLGEGRGNLRRQDRGGGGIGFLLKIPGGGGVSKEAEGPGGCLWRIRNLGVGGLNIFFRGRNVLQDYFGFQPPWKRNRRNKFHLGYTRKF